MRRSLNAAERRMASPLQSIRAADYPFSTVDLNCDRGVTRVDKIS